MSTTTTSAPAWNPLTDWKHADISWVRVNISKEDLRRFTERSTWRGLLQAGGYLLLVAATGVLCYWAFSARLWGLLVPALLVHGTFWAFFGNAQHELVHNTVFPGRTMNVIATALFGWIFWPMNPHFYRLSHLKYHHRYTLHQGSDGEDTPNYVDITPKLLASLFLHVLHPLELLKCLYRFFTLTPLSKGWRGRGFGFDAWETFIWKNATPAEKAQVRRMGVAVLVGHTLLAAACVYFGYWFIPVIVFLAPFYGFSFVGYQAGIHQHAACEANANDFRRICTDAILDPLSSFLYWRMEYHIEHHMFAAIPCYNLKKFSRFVADQLPPKRKSLPRIRELARLSRERFGSYEDWRAAYGVYKGL